MKQTLRLPTADQYAYIELEIDPGEDLTDEMVQEAHSNYKRSINEIKGGGGLEKRAFDLFLDRYLTGEQNSVEEYMKMDETQKSIIQCIKRSKARINSRIKE